MVAVITQGFTCLNPNGGTGPTSVALDNEKDKKEDNKEHSDESPGPARDRATPGGSPSPARQAGPKAQLAFDGDLSDPDSEEAEDLVRLLPWALLFACLVNLITSFSFAHARTHMLHLHCHEHAVCMRKQFSAY